MLTPLTLHIMCACIYTCSTVFLICVLCFVCFAMQYTNGLYFELSNWEEFCLHVLKSIIRTAVFNFNFVTRSGSFHSEALHKIKQLCPYVYLSLYCSCIKIGGKKIMKIWGWVREVDKTLSSENAEIWHPHVFTVNKANFWQTNKY